jgi:hypothetical protein
MKKGLCIALALSGCVLGAVAQDCKNRPEVISSCFVIHGRAEYGNGTPALRIWRVGTQHKYGISDDPLIVPKNLLGSLHDFDYSVYGDYEICPYTREKPGAMTMGCIQTARNLVVTEYKTTKVVKR